MERVDWDDDRPHVLSLGTELKSAVSAAGKRKGTDTLSDGPACKRPALLATQFVVSVSLFSSEHSVEPFLGWCCCLRKLFSALVIEASHVPYH